MQIAARIFYLMGNMGGRWLFKILLAVLALRGSCHGQECDSNGVSCINCTDYQECSGGAPKGPIFSCKNGADCGNQPLLEHCWTKLNCYALNDCTEAGIFPDVMSESNYFVCLPDSGSGFLKYDFTCPDGEFFDKTSRVCIASAITSETTLPPTSETTAAASTSESDPEFTVTSDTTTATQTTSSIAETKTPATTPLASTSGTTTTTVSTPAPTPETTTTVSTPAPTPETTTTVSTPAPTPETTTTVSTPAPTPETTTTVSTPAPTPETTATVSTPAPTPETTTTVSTPAPTTQPPPFACTAPGIFPNPTNCKMYFRCSTSLMVFYYTCPGTSYFNENILKCSLIITPACREQILQNTTSATPITTSTPITTPVPTTLTTTTTISEPTTLSSTQASTTATTQAPATTTTQAPAVPFSCSAAGTFENPVDCKTYYRCSSTGKSFLYVCPNGLYYNEFTKRCGLTITPRCRSKLIN